MNISKQMQRQELGDAEIFADMYRDKVVYDHNEGLWYVFDEHTWKVDNKSSITKMVDGVAKVYEQEIARLNIFSDEHAYKFWRARINHLRRQSGIHNVLNLAKSYVPLEDEWDDQPMLLACPNGVINLEKGELRDGQPQDYLRTAIPTEYNKDAVAPRFKQFLDEIFDGDTEIIEFVQRLFGYAITGHSIEHVLPIFYGPEGRNGKDTLLETIHNVLGGDVVAPLSKEVLLSGHQNPGVAAPFLYELIGKRLVYADETSEGARFDEGQIKQITGGAPFPAKKLYQQPTTVYPKYLIVIMTNSKPKVDADDPAMWERLFVVSFTQRFVEKPKYNNEHKVDKYLKSKLKSEASGILNWLIAGCLEWQKRGSLDIPESVRLETEDYKDEQAGLDTFIESECVLDNNERILVSDFYTSFSEFADVRQSRKFQSAVTRKMAARGFGKKRFGEGYCFCGLRLKPTPSEEFEELIALNANHA